ncbi:MAG: HEAT repeat domain-containing protein, partial [Gemmatimonadetes bacterium]|nr:HEAT repeat domain-containing protein [Gemmatimonadota bacterium]
AIGATPALKIAIKDSHWWVRRNAIEALGAIGDFSSELLSDLTQELGDEDYRVRRNAALTLAKFGELSDSDIAIEALAPMIEDENRYNRVYAAYVLQQIGTPAARDILFHTLFNARWCSITTKDNMY